MFGLEDPTPPLTPARHAPAGPKARAPKAWAALSALGLALAACNAPTPAPVGEASPSPLASPQPPGPNSGPSTAPSPSAAPNQAQVQGHIYDAAGAPVAGAEVQVVGQSARATSGADGAFTLSGLPTLVNLEVVASAPQCPSRRREAAFVPGPNPGFDFGRAAPITPLASPVPRRLAEPDASFLEPGVELLALSPTQDAQASASFGNELRFAFSSPLSEEGAQRFVRMTRLWPNDEQAVAGAGAVKPLATWLKFGQAAPTLVAPWAIAHGTTFRGRTAMRAEVELMPDRQNGRFRLPLPLPNSREGAEYQLGWLADEGPIRSADGQIWGALPDGSSPQDKAPGELLRAVVLEPEASLAHLPELPTTLARRHGRRSPNWRFHLPGDLLSPKLVDASAGPEGADLVFRFIFNEPLVAFDPVASAAGGRAGEGLRGSGDLLKAFTFAFAEKQGELDGVRLEGEPAHTWDPLTQNQPTERKAELRLAAGARVDNLAGAADGSVLVELPEEQPTWVVLRVRGRAKALEGLDFWGVRVGAISDPIGNRRNESQSNAEVLKRRR